MTLRMRIATCLVCQSGRRGGEGEDGNEGEGTNRLLHGVTPNGAGCAARRVIPEVTRFAAASVAEEVSTRIPFLNWLTKAAPGTLWNCEIQRCPPSRDRQGKALRSQCDRSAHRRDGSNYLRVCGACAHLLVIPAGNLCSHASTLPLWPHGSLQLIPLRRSKRRELWRSGTRTTRYHAQQQPGPQQAGAPATAGFTAYTFTLAAA